MVFAFFTDRRAFFCVNVQRPKDLGSFYGRKAWNSFKKAFLSTPVPGKSPNAP
jgi:hypothetical protein